MKKTIIAAAGFGLVLILTLGVLVSVGDSPKYKQVTPTITIAPPPSLTPAPTKSATTSMSYKYKAFLVSCVPGPKLVVRGWVLEGPNKIDGKLVRVSLAVDGSALYEQITGPEKGDPGFFSINIEPEYLGRALHVYLVEGGIRISSVGSFTLDNLPANDPNSCQRETVNFQLTDIK